MYSPKPESRADRPDGATDAALPSLEEDDRHGRDQCRVVNGVSLAPRAPMFSFEFSAQLSKFAYREPAFDPLIHEPPKMDGRNSVMTPTARCFLQS